MGMPSLSESEDDGSTPFSVANCLCRNVGYHNNINIGDYDGNRDVDN